MNSEVGPSTSSSSLPPGVNMTKAKVKKKKHDWTWEDEVLMYDVSQRDAAKKKKLCNKVILKAKTF